MHFQPRGMGGGGALFFPSINPADDNDFYVSCDMSEMFHSKDFGLNYSQLDFRNLQVFGISTYEFTNDPLIAYSNFNDGNEGYPVKTTDGGVSWNRISGYDQASYGHVYAMKSNYHNPQQLLINSYGEILFSGNGGTTFSSVKHASNMGAGIILGGVYWDGSSVYIGTNEGIYYSANNGASFAQLPASGIPAGQVILSFAGAGSGSSLRFVCITANVSDTYNGIMPWDYYNLAKGVYVMDQANGTWVSRSSGINFSTDFIMYAGMAWNDPQTIYLGGHDNTLYAPLVFKSSDGGLSWTKVFKTTNNQNIITGWEGYNGDKNWSWSETCFGISVAPMNSQKVLFGGFSNVQATSDGGNNWRQAYVDPSGEHAAGSSTPNRKPYHSIGLENTTCWQVHWSDAGKMMGCFSDIGGIRSKDGGASWGYQYQGFEVNSLYRVEENNGGTLFGACSRVHDMYESTRLTDAQLDVNDPTGMIVYSTDQGENWQTLHVFNHPVYWLAIDPSDQNQMYASVIHFGGTQGAQQGGIYMTHDLGNLASATWTKLPNPPRTEGHPACLHVLNDGKLLCTFSGRRNPSGSFTASSGVFIYDPVQGSWTDVSDPGMYYWTRDVILDPADPSQNTWLVAVYSGWGGAPNGLGGLYRTTDRGIHWTKLTGSLFDRVASLTFNPGKPGRAYLTTETQGLWVSDDMTSATPSWSLVSTYPFRQPERVYFNPYKPEEMWVTSFGNGLKVGNINGTGFSDDITRPNEVSIFPSPNHGTFTLHCGRSLKDGRLQISDLTGRIVSHQKINTTTGEMAISFNPPASGVYTWILFEDNQVIGQGEVQILN